jgi:rhamnose utilization protein RhaD (predicted bifunctional aldolase and dehydrogenase)
LGEDRWDESHASGLDLIAGLVYRSNLFGVDRALAAVGARGSG